jgi:hypothetical protein
MRKYINIVEHAEQVMESQIPQDVAREILADRRCQRGVKISASARLWRGQGEHSGSGMASYGRGFYMTCDRRAAQAYGDVIELPRSVLPDNPLRFATKNDFQIWLQQAQRRLGYSDNREFVAAYHDLGDFIRALDPTIDGIQMYSGRDAQFVVYDGNDPFGGAE